jgi:hypothetical protein
VLTADEIAGMRETVESAQPDTCTITRPVAGGSLDPWTAVWTPFAATAIYTGVCRVRTPTSEEVEELFGDREIVKQRLIGTFPHDVPHLEVSDVVVLTETGDPEHADRPYRVTGFSSGSWLLGRRVALEAVE